MVVSRVCTLSLPLLSEVSSCQQNVIYAKCICTYRPTYQRYIVRKVHCWENACVLVGRCGERTPVRMSHPPTHTLYLGFCSTVLFCPFLTHTTCRSLETFRNCCSEMFYIFIHCESKNWTLIHLNITFANTVRF